MCQGPATYDTCKKAKEVARMLALKKSLPLRSAKRAHDGSLKTLTMECQDAGVRDLKYELECIALGIGVAGLDNFR